MEEQPPEEKVIRAMEKVADVYGFRQSYAKMFGTLYFSEDEMTLDQLSEETGYARSTISEAMKDMERFYMVEREKKEGEGKKLFYSANEDMEDMFIKLLENEVSSEIDIMLDALEEAEEELEDEGEEEKLEKVRNLQSTYSRAERFVNVVQKIPSRNPLKKLTDLASRIYAGKQGKETS
jgi:DNA-binding transcriptional regulator GbsR (MarR family)